MRQFAAAPALVPAAGGYSAARLRLLVLPRPQHASFCRAHNTRTTSDPEGSVDISAADWSLVEHYRFGTGSAEFLICKRCGVYIDAIGETASGTRAVINTNCLDDRVAFTQQPNPVDHDGEATGDRLARRATNWTPATIHR